jgi:hypothetical protein
MIRFSLAAVISAFIALHATVAFADAAPVGGCGGGGHYSPQPPRPCTAEAWSNVTGHTCVLCAATDTACTGPLVTAGYTVRCIDILPAGEQEVLCPAGTGQAERGHLTQLAGLFALVAVLAGVRLVRSRL